MMYKCSCTPTTDLFEEAPHIQPVNLLVNVGHVDCAATALNIVLRSVSRRLTVGQVHVMNASEKCVRPQTLQRTCEEGISSLFTGTIAVLEGRTLNGREPNITPVLSNA